HDVQQDEIGTIPFDQFEGGRPILREQKSVILLQCVSQNLQIARFIIHQQQGGAFVVKLQKMLRLLGWVTARAAGAPAGAAPERSRSYLAPPVAEWLRHGVLRFEDQRTPFPKAPHPTLGAP